jgi:predicted phosphodiesterase
MRVFALSDLHVDFEANAQWVQALSRSDYQDDVLILAGDVSDSLARLGRCLHALALRFRRVFFVPGNHELWVVRDGGSGNSLHKFEQVMSTAADCGVATTAEHIGGVSIVPLLGWYDHSFGQPSTELAGMWSDFHACRWPAGWTASDITEHFVGRNVLPGVSGSGEAAAKPAFTISFSHFLPRIDVMPGSCAAVTRKLQPVLGSRRLEALIREIGSNIHVYGHSHVNRNVVIDGVNYVNNAFAYPYEEHIAAKALKCIHSTR